MERGCGTIAGPAHRAVGFRGQGASHQSCRHGGFVGKRRGVIDENAFGVLFSNFALEEDEYRDDDLPAFVKRFMLFRSTVRSAIETGPPATSVQVYDLGHAVYIEFSDGDQCVSLFPWIGGVRAQLAKHAFESVVVLSYGGRWLEEPDEASHDSARALSGERAASVIAESVAGTDFRHQAVMHPSEPFRRANYAETATHGDLNEEGGWGKGFYADTDAVQALGLTPKNQPTVLGIAGASYFRIKR